MARGSGVAARERKTPTAQVEAARSGAEYASGEGLTPCACALCLARGLQQFGLLIVIRLGRLVECPAVAPARLAAIERQVGQSHGVLVQSSPRLAQPYVTPTLTVTYGRVGEPACAMPRSVTALRISAAMRRCIGAVTAGQDGDELLAAVARHHVQRTALHGAADRRGDPLQAVIAGLMSVAVVVGLEVIDIDQQHRDRQPRQLRRAATALAPAPRARRGSAAR